jgi:exodeoxyribonuclease-3
MIMKLATFNVNSVRKRTGHIAAFAGRTGTHIIGLQETKTEDQFFPAEELAELGFHSEFYGQKTHYGVAVLSKTAPVEVIKGITGEGEQKRFIMCRYETASGPLSVINCYFPQGENRDVEKKFTMKREFYAGVLGFIKDNFKDTDLYALMGDFNVAYSDLDIGIGDDNAKRWLREGKCSFLPEEREWMSGFFSIGMKDAYRIARPDSADFYSWFDYRSKGFEREPKRGLRIDTILASSALAPKCVDAGIDYETRGMASPSDHCPLWAEFGL